MRPPLDWQTATVKAVQTETPSVKTLTLALPHWTPHRAGQYYHVRLTAEDGHQVHRSYSVASEPERIGEIDLTVEKIDKGELSPYLYDVLAPGDPIDVRGPIGGHFVWEGSRKEPLLLIGGGSGIVPLMSMLRHREAAGAQQPARLLYSSPTFDDIIYYCELEKLQEKKDGLEVFHTLTRDQPPGWPGYARRIDEKMLREVVEPLGVAVAAFICGPTELVKSAADALVQQGLPPAQIRTEHFGETDARPGG
jgi:ferredoxin-NADP reductase